MKSKCNYFLRFCQSEKISMAQAFGHIEGKKKVLSIYNLIYE